jgi:hypothetical protein
MAKFETGTLVLEQICLDSSPKPDGQRSVSLQLTGWKRQPDIQTGTTNFLRVTTVTHDAVRKRSTFRIEAVRDANGVAYVFDNASDDDTILRVTVGKVTNHGGFKHDLLADLLGRSEAPVKLLAYQRILSKEDNIVGDRAQWDRILKDQPLKQITDPDHPAKWNCGAAASKFGNTYFGSTHYTAEKTRYYKPFRSSGQVNKMDDIQFDADKLAKGVAEIQRLLAGKVAVRVFAVHHDGFTVQNGIIRATGETHFLTIIGCDTAGERFLVTDPWPGGSRLIYTSGIFGNVDSAFMGLLQNFGGSTGIRTSAEAQRGAHQYRVLSGP